jgi:hypothetical protein
MSDAEKELIDYLQGELQKDLEKYVSQGIMPDMLRQMTAEVSGQVRSLAAPFDIVPGLGLCETKVCVLSRPGEDRVVLGVRTCPVNRG